MSKNPKRTVRVPEDTRTRTQGRTVIAWVNLRSDSNWNPARSEREVELPATTARLSVSDIGPRSVKHDQCDCDKLLNLSVLSAHACEVTQYDHVQRESGHDKHGTGCYWPHVLADYQDGG